MNELQIFNSPEFGDIRAVEMDGEPWFVGKDMAAALGYKNPQEAIRTHVDDEDKGVSEILTPGGKQSLPIINESGVYSLIFSSRLEKAKEFKRWVTSVVLPSLRKHGAYIAPGAAPQGVEAAALQAVLQPFAAAMETLTAAVQGLNQRMDAMEQQPVRKALPPSLTAENPFADCPVDIKPPTNKMRRQWMRTASDKLNMLADKCGLPSSCVLHRLYQEMEDELGVILSEVRLKALEEHQLTDCSILVAIFYDKPLRKWFVTRVEAYLSQENVTW